MDTLIRMVAEQKEQQESLAEEQRGQFTSIHNMVACQQRETEEKFVSLQTDLSLMQQQLEERLSLAERRLGELQLEQQGLQGQQLQGTQWTELQESVTERVKEEPGLSGGRETSGGQGSATSKIRPEALTFVPLGDIREEPTLPEGGAEVTNGIPVSKSLHRPAPFDGKSPWEAYLTQFELLADLNRWGAAEKAAYLAVSLRGPALTVLTNLPAGKRCDYKALTSALQNRFGSGHQAELNRAKFRGRYRQRDEILPALAEDVERLARLAYPDAEESMIVTLAKDQFIDALEEDDWKLRIRQLRPQTLQQALETALELESYSLAGRSQRNKPVRGVSLDNEAKSQGPNESQLVKQLQECLEVFKQNVGDRPPNRSEQSRAGRRARVTCWNCRKRGHYQRECSEPPQQLPRTPQQDSTGMTDDVRSKGTNASPSSSLSSSSSPPGNGQ